MDYATGITLPFVKFNADGSLDSSFNHKGIIIADQQGSGYAIQTQTNGQILVAGSIFDSSSVSNFVLIRYNTNGLLDSAFGSKGIDNADFQNGKDIAYSIASQQDDKILVGGYATIDSIVQFAMIRYDSAGNPDLSFGDNGKVHSLIGKFCQANSIKILNDNKILLGGYAFKQGKYEFALARYNSNEIIDSAFGKKGISLISL